VSTRNDELNWLPGRPTERPCRAARGDTYHVRIPPCASGSAHHTQTPIPGRRVVGMAHCHIAEHHEAGMMLRFTVDDV
jgi:FtsP/CotA-like multicopper oxidase with cupredoxin domain